MPIIEIDYEAAPTNILGLPDPQSWECTINNYGAGLSIMRIDLFNLAKNQRMSISFGGVFYFEGIMSWRGANFTIASHDECRDLVKKLGLFKDFPQAAFDYVTSKRTHLFFVRTSNNFNIRLIATDVNIIEK